MGGLPIRWIKRLLCVFLFILFQIFVMLKVAWASIWIAHLMSLVMVVLFVVLYGTCRLCFEERVRARINTEDGLNDEAVELDSVV